TLLSVPVRKPLNSWFVRVHPSPEYRLPTGVIELKDEGEFYVVDKKLHAALAVEPTFSPRVLFTAKNRQGVLFLWPIRLPGPEGRIDDYNRTALEAAERATKVWLRIMANSGLGAYDAVEPLGDYGEPDWSDTPPFQELLRIALKDHLITDLNQPVLRRLRG